MPATHLAILYANRSEFDRKQFSQLVDVDTPGDFFHRLRRCGSFENSCDKIAQPDGLAIRSNKCRKSQEWAHLVNAGEFNCRYLTCQISAILYADHGDQRNRNRCTGHTWQFSLFRSNRRIKSLGAPPALLTTPKKRTNASYSSTSVSTFC